MNQVKMHKLIEYLRAAGEFPFDVDDVEKRLGEVLGFFGIVEQLAADEERALRAALVDLALAEQEVEVVRLAERECW